MTPSWLLSADSHVVEPPEVWDRVEPDFRARAPKLVEADDGDWIVVEGQRLLAMTIGAQAGKRFEGLDKLSATGRWRDVAPGAYDPDAQIADNEADGVWGVVLYPTVMTNLFRYDETPFFSALARAYNDWMTEFCASHPDRLKGIAVINPDDPAEAAAELERVRNRGAAGGFIPTTLKGGGSYADPALEPLWAAAAALDMPLSLHMGAMRTPYPRSGFDKAHMEFASFRPNMDYHVRIAMTAMIAAGVPARYPTLRIACVEHECGWVPFWLYRMDDTYTTNWLGNHVHRYPDGVLPSDVFREHFFVAFQDDMLGLRDRHLIGIDTLMWGNDYPHTETTWPRSREVVDEIMRDVSAEDRQKLTVANTSRLYGFEVPEPVSA